MARPEASSHAMSRPKTRPGPPKTSNLSLLFGGKNISSFQSMLGGLFLELSSQGVDLLLLRQDLLLLGLRLGPERLQFQFFDHHFVPQRNRFFEKAVPEHLHFLGLFRAQI
jgi:hypothetical protein